MTQTDIGAIHPLPETKVGAIHPIKPKMGRPRLKIDERGPRLLAVVVTGLPLSKACDLVRLRFDTMQAWRARNPEFEEQVKEALAEGENRLLQVVAAAAPKSWQAAAWILERSKGYVQTTKQEVTGRDGGPITTAAINVHLLAGLGRAVDLERVKVVGMPGESRGAIK